MAVTDIPEDDLDEMMREEAEDVFYEDGRRTMGSAGKCWKTSLLVGCCSCSVCTLRSWLVCDLKLLFWVNKRVKVMLECWPRGISSAV